MTYDPVRQRVVLFGGSSGPDETWEYDGITWTQRCTGTEEHPPGRIAHGMAYDAARGEVLLFGGHDGGGDVNDTWVLPSSGGCWVEKTPANMPSKREYPAVAYDSDCEVVLLFGGQSPLSNDLWAWDGNNWTNVPLCAGCTDRPSPRYTAAMVYDAPNRKMVLFGGTSGSYEDDTWEWSWNCSTGSWTQVCTTDQPTPRIHTGMAYVDSCSRIMLFGGSGNEAIALDDTWVYPIRCGDGVVEGTEFCDDGFTDACGSCNADCTGLGNNSTCPDGVVCPETEQCDDGNSDDTDFCLNDCTINPAIPAVSEWGIVVMTLLVMTAGTVVLMRRRSVEA